MEETKKITKKQVIFILSIINKKSLDCKICA